ncbi:uncharacterized protein ACWYII_007141 isoform 3-T7 [Salvelinus alpinus]
MLVDYSPYLQEEVRGGEGPCRGRAHTGQCVMKRYSDMPCKADNAAFQQTLWSVTSIFSWSGVSQGQCTMRVEHCPVMPALSRGWRYCVLMSVTWMTV